MHLYCWPDPSTVPSRGFWGNLPASRPYQPLLARWWAFREVWLVMVAVAVADVELDRLRFGLSQ